jgi:apolipoprotein N-acyltransferase
LKRTAHQKGTRAAGARKAKPERNAYRIGARAALVCAVTGALGAACFYLPQLAFLLWFIPVPALALLFAESENRGRAARRRSIKLAAAFTLPFFFCSYLVGFTIDVYFSRPVMLLLDLALILVASLLQAIPQIAALCIGSRIGLPAAIRALAAALLWTGAEWLTTVGPFAFPVRSLAVSQWAFPSLIKTSALFGGLFISFIIILFASLLALSLSLQIRGTGFLRTAGLRSEESAVQTAALQHNELSATTAGSHSAELPVNAASLSDEKSPVITTRSRSGDFLVNAMSKPGAAKRRAIVFLISAFIVFFANITAGALATRGFAGPGESDNTLRIAAVQHNQPTTDDDSSRFSNALSQSADILEANDVDLLALPESTAQFVRGNWAMQTQLSALARRYEVDILVGGANRITDESAEDSGTQTRSASDKDGAGGAGSGIVNLNKAMKNGVLLENAVHLFTPDGGLADYYYAKQQLVPFFENGSIQKFSFFAGDRRGVFKTENGRVGALVCFESILPQIVRDTVNAGAEVILVPSNDAYLGEEIRTMHISQSVFRAIETDRAVVQAATNGVTAAAYPDGTLVQLPMNTADALIADVPLVDHITPYVRFGNLWLIIAIAALLAGAGLGRFLRKSGE